MMSKIFGANWKTTLSGIGSAIFSLLTVMAALPDTLGAISTIIPEQYKHYLVIVGLVGATGLKVWNSVAQKSKEVTGGTVQQTTSGAPAAAGTQNLVDMTVKATNETNQMNNQPKPPQTGS